MIRIELRKILKLKITWLCLILGIASGLVGLISYYSDAYFIIASGQGQAISAFQAWLYCLSLSSETIYKIIAPLLIVAGLDSVFVERKSGYTNFILSRVDKRNYIVGKWMAGVTVAVVTLLLVILSWLIVCLVLFPANMPVDRYTYIHETQFKNLFVTSPLAYIVMVLILNTIFAIVFYSIGFSIALTAKSRYIVSISPFIIYLFLVMLAAIMKVPYLSPLPLVVPNEVIGLSLIHIVIYGAIIGGLTLLLFFKQYYKWNREVI